ncbi:MAG: hypothetical protein AAFO94_13610 [Bacteroidota bacterium]
MRFKQIFGSILLVAFLSSLAFKLNEHLPRNDDKPLLIVLCVVIVLIIIIGVRKVLTN